MIKIINKKMLNIKLLYLITGMFLMVIFSLLSRCKIISSKTYIANSGFVICAIFFTLLAIKLYHKEENKKQEKLSVINPIVSLVFPIVLILFYQIPAFGFFDLLGVNNSIIIIYLFSSYSFFVYDISFILKDNYGSTVKKIGYTAKGKYYVCKLVKYFATYIVIMSFVFAIINLFDPKFNVSFLFGFFEFNY